MKFSSLLLSAAFVIAGATLAGETRAADISGAGATFPYPIYAKWADSYKKETGTGLNYQSIGSGGGIKQITARTVTFGASDMPLKPEQLEKAGLIQFPTVMGGIVPVINLEGIRFNDAEKTNVEEYCVSEGWIRVAAGSARDRHGNPLTMKLNGKVEPYFRDKQTDA